MTHEKEENLRSMGNLFQEPDSTLLLASGMGELSSRALVDTRSAHAKNKIAGRIIPFLVLDSWDKSTYICAGAMTYRQ